MAESFSPASTSATATASATTTTATAAINIPVDIVSDEEMAFIEAALASTRSILSSSSSSSRVTCSASLTSILSPLRSHAASASSSRSHPAPDIEDCIRTQRPRSLLQQFRRRRGLTVTDITSTEWCDKQMEFVLLRGKPKRTKAMEAGSARHVELEQEVIEKVEIRVKSIEDSWAIKLLNFVAGTNQLLFEGLTRELPVIGVIEGIWTIGVIDEIKMQVNGAISNPILSDTKTRHKATIPSESQKRNARLQLMCYKYLWDSLVDKKFPADYFFTYFGLNPMYVLSEDVKQFVASLRSEARTFGDVVNYFRDACCLLLPSQELLQLRYELQSDRSLLEEYQFTYDAIWFKNQIKECISFWRGKREAKYVAEDEKWKCGFCTFTAMCPMTTPGNEGSSI